MGKILGLSHVGVYVRDLEKMAAFYRDVLGLAESRRDGERSVSLTSNKEVEDHEILLLAGRDGDARIIQQISFRTGSVEDVKAFYDSFKRLGIPIHMAFSYGAGISCNVLDPEGNRVEIFADVPGERETGYRGRLDLEKTAQELIAQVQGRE